MDGDIFARVAGPQILAQGDALAAMSAATVGGRFEISGNQIREIKAILSFLCPEYADPAKLELDNLHEITDCEYVDKDLTKGTP